MTEQYRCTSVDTRFKAGNPGRPKGARHKTTVMAEKLMTSGARDVVAAIIAAAQKGDPTAMRLCLDRILPARKGRALILDLPEITDASSVIQSLAVLMAAAGDGSLSAEEANDYAALIDVQRRAIETVELEKRIIALEQKDGRL